MDSTWCQVYCAPSSERTVLPTPDWYQTWPFDFVLATEMWEKRYAPILSRSFNRSNVWAMFLFVTHTNQYSQVRAAPSASSWNKTCRAEQQMTCNTQKNRLWYCNLLDYRHTKFEMSLKYKSRAVRWRVGYRVRYLENRYELEIKFWSHQHLYCIFIIRIDKINRERGKKEVQNKVLKNTVFNGQVDEDESTKKIGVAISLEESHKGGF